MSQIPLGTYYYPTSPDENCNCLYYGKRMVTIQQEPRLQIQVKFFDEMIWINVDESQLHKAKCYCGVC